MPALDADPALPEQPPSQAPAEVANPLPMSVPRSAVAPVVTATCGVLAAIFGIKFAVSQDQITDAIVTISAIVFPAFSAYRIWYSNRVKALPAARVEDLKAKAALYDAHVAAGNIANQANPTR